MIEVERIDDFLNGRINYYIKGTKIFHREDGPAIEFEDGLKETIQWYRDNEAWWKPLKNR